jgi:hypothetical protein
MYISYVDESGHCGTTTDPSQPVEVLCGVRTDVTKLFKTQRQHAQLLSVLHKYNIQVSELKASDAYSGRNAWHSVDAKIRDAIFEVMFDWFHQRYCKFTICPIDSGKFFSQKKTGNPIAKLLGYPYEAGALNVILSLQKQERSTKNNKGKTFIVFDEQPKHDQRVLELLEGDLSFTDRYTGFQDKPRAKERPQRLDQVIDVPYFSKSHLSVLIQLADWAAFVTNRYLLIQVYGSPERYAGEAKKIRSWYEEIGDCLITRTCIDPPGTGDTLIDFYSSVRPDGWTARQWTI